MGDVEAFLKKLKTDWAESVSYDKEKGVIETVGKQKESCPCPFVGKTKISKNFCDCSIGWYKESFKAVSGKDVEVERTASILHGDKTCDFRVKLT